MSARFSPDRTPSLTPASASYYCCRPMIDRLLYLVDEEQCNPACTKNNDCTPLHLACQNGHLDVAKYLVDEKKCNPACTNNDGWTPLHSACLTGQLDVAKYLID